VCCISGWYAIERVISATDVFFLILSIAKSRAFGQTNIDVGDGRLEPAENRENEVIGTGKPGLRQSDHVPIRHDRSLKDRVLASGRPHTERVPRLHNTVARRVARHDGVHYLRVIGVGGIEPIDLEPIPNRRQRAEMLVAKEPVATIDPLGLTGSVEHLEVVA
jgi:hypothetical protein